ncbi:hypothetical protein [Pseudoclavibacter soli]|uniref:hypothetical protein n=1 Tax=Pseudoclavibacter soli TaxID=452623 RepID=UPI0004004319|nr:hypothetical protein [Pseudoclavibacter soli]
MSETTQTLVILNALAATEHIDGETSREHDARVKAKIYELSARLGGENNPLVTAAQAIAECDVFTAVVGLVKKEKSSTRGLVYLVQNPDEWTRERLRDEVHTGYVAARKDYTFPDGVEVIRTDRTDTPEGLLLAKRATELVGHKVVVYKAHETLKNDANRKVKILRHLTDLGPTDLQER